MRWYLTLIVIVSVGAMLTPASASAHGTWYYTRAQVEQGIEEKYPAVSAALCKPVPEWARGRYGVDSFVARSGSRVWNHFLCAVWSTRLNAPCMAISHHVGRMNHLINLTSWPGEGCSTRALWG